MYFNEELSKFLLSNKKEINNELEFIKNFNHRDEYYKIKRYLDDFLNDSIDERFIVLPGLR
ncbi:MAG: hypothetical protein LBM96_13100 [Methanobrevibacter sp.]|jgi:hypothetical protein|nr:hypothetical protein [Candidatus Methanoflexus mossambicus]